MTEGTAHRRIKTPPFWRRWIMAEVATVLLAGGFLGASLSPLNRIYLFWGWIDTLAVLVLLLFVGTLVALGLARLNTATRGRSDRWLSPWFFFLVVLVAFNLDPDLWKRWENYLPWLQGAPYFLMIWAIGGVLTLAAYVRPSLRKLAERGWRALFFLWPLLPILMFHFIWASNWAPAEEAPSLPERRTGGDSPPSVVLVILDMVGYDDAFEETRQVRKNIPHLAAFAESATAYHGARSPGDFTGESLPGLIFQCEVGYPIWSAAGVRWREKGGGLRCAEDFERSLPCQFKSSGGRAAFVGMYLPYDKLMPGAWDFMFTRSFYGVALERPLPKFIKTLLFQAVQFLRVSKDPVSAISKQLNLYHPLLDQHQREITLDVARVGEACIRNFLSPGDFLMLHLPIPHQPFVFSPDGGPGQFGRLDPAGYSDQLVYADHLFGRWIQTLKETGQWDCSWVVVLSDHASHLRDWRADPGGKRHVLFMVKSPWQTERRDDETPFHLTELDRIPKLIPLPP